jgi:hypothetical protein
VGWRVRKMKQKGAPEVVYGRNGMPLVIPIEADIEDVRAETPGPGRYRLDPVGEGNRPIADSPVGYVFIHNRTEAPAVESVVSSTPTDNVVVEAMRMNAEIAKSVVDRFPQMLEAASSLLRAADGAGLPARLPLVAEHVEGEEDGNEDEAPTNPPGGFDLNAVVAQLVPLVITSLMNGKLKIPGLGDMLDWRKAAANAPKQKREPSKPAASASAVAEDVAPVVEPMIPPLDPDTIAHFMAIQAALKPEEAAVARAVAADLAPVELRAWFDDLKKLSIPDAVAKIRSLISKKGGAS